MRVTSVQCHMKVFNTRQREDRSVHYKTKTACSLLVVFFSRIKAKCYRGNVWLLLDDSLFTLFPEYSFRWMKLNHSNVELSLTLAYIPRISASDDLAVGSDSTDRNLGVVGIVQGANKTRLRGKLFSLVAELDGDCISPTRSLRDTTTQDTDEPEIQPVSEPEKSA